MRSGREASQAMLIHGNNRMSQIMYCIDASSSFLLSRKNAIEIAQNQIDIITQHWIEVCNIAELSEIDRRLLWGRQFLNPYALEGFNIS